MRIGDSAFLDLIQKVRSWFSWGSASGGLKMLDESSLKMSCCDSAANAKDHLPRYHCLRCSRDLCGKCIRGSESLAVLESDKVDGRVRIKGCRSCTEISVKTESRKKYCEKVHPRDSPEPPSPCFSGSERIDSSMHSESVQSDSLAIYLEAQERVCLPHGVTSSSMADFSPRPSPVSVRRSPTRCRSDEEEAEDTGKHFFSPSNESCRDISDIDTRSFSFRHDFYSKSSGSTPSDSPSRMNFTTNRGRHFVQQEQEESPVSRGSPFSQEGLAVLRRPDTGTEDAENTDYCSDDMSVFRSQYVNFQKPLDFENNELIWFPPPPNDEEDEMESNYFEYDDDEDDVGDSGAMFTSSSSLSCIFPAKERQHEGSKEPLRALVQVHFRALVSQLLYGEGIKMDKEDGAEEWLEIVTAIAWQAANFVKPDTSRGGSMDPCDYVRIKRVASGSPKESTLIKGVVCTKNIKHKRMTSQYKNPRILILGGALEYQRVPNQLASFDTLLQQENDHLKMIISKIEALHPNVLLVEKSVSSCAQGYLLEKDISLVLNVKRPLLERISRCTGAPITPSIDNISMARLGHCELFRLERVAEEHETNNQSSKKSSKTLMFFEGCPRRLGCTVVLRGACREELKKVKHVVQYAVFAAYHLSLQTSFLADEGATLPKMSPKTAISSPEKTSDTGNLNDSTSAGQSTDDMMVDIYNQEEGAVDGDLQHGVMISLSNVDFADSSLSPQKDVRLGTADCEAYDGDLIPTDALESNLLSQQNDLKESNILPSESQILFHPEFMETMVKDGENEVSSEYFSAADTNQSILVSFSSRCVLKGTVCERSRLQRIKFYGCFDKPLGRYLRDDLFSQTCYCRSCKEPAEAHVLCYTHQQGNLTVNLKRLPSLKLPGEQDGKIWMWHRCLKCALVNGVPPAARRVVMSDAAWGLSFGKFLELSFSNHATANRVATCGHSLQRDCLRYYGFGSMVAFFRYSPIDILSVCLPPSMLEFNGSVRRQWLRKEAGELFEKMETLYVEVAGVLDTVEEKSARFGHEFIDMCELHNYILELKDLLQKERADYSDLLELALADSSRSDQSTMDILELNRLQRSLVIGSRVWDRRLYSLDLLLEINSPKSKQGNTLSAQLKELRIDFQCKFDASFSVSSSLARTEHTVEDSKATCYDRKEEDVSSDAGTLSDTLASDEPNLSERIDSAWTGSDQSLQISAADSNPGSSTGQTSETESPSFRRLMAPMRVHSFDSALRVRDRIQKGLPSSALHLSTVGSFHASGEYRNMVRDPVSNVMRTYSQLLPRDSQRISPSLISSASLLSLGARLLLPQAGRNDIVIAVYDDEPTSIISYALSSKEYEDWISIKADEHGGDWRGIDGIKEDSAASSFSGFQSFTSLDLENVNCGNYVSEDTPSSLGALFRDPKRSPHFRISFGDESSPGGGKVKFSVTCYFAKQFDSLRWKCCPSELDFVQSLSRCRRWSAQGGKSNVYFAKSMDERFIIKQVTKTELDSFEDFAPEYFKYLNDSLSSGSPTCLAKVLGLYQVTVKHLRGGRETKMDLMVMENLFYKRSISRVYDLKGSARARYNPDTTGKDKVLLDLNLLEALRTKPIFLGSKAKRRLERAIWNDTSFLASVDVMDYSLLVGVDDESKELVLGIIDFMRQYTWDKHLETWVKASGILGGPKNASPTIISPKQYKKRFRKAMTTYFLTVPDQWSS